MVFKIVKIWMIVILLLAPFFVADANGNTDLKTGGIENTKRSAIATDAKVSQPFTYDFFISYNWRDQAWAEWIAWQLENSGYKTVIQAWDFRPGNNIVLKMQDATKNSKRTIMVLSPNYFKSNYTPSEWAAAFWQDPRGSDCRLVPVLVLDCTLEGLIPDISYIDLRNKNESSAKKLLIDGVKTDRAKPKSSPGYPGPKSLSDSNERKSLYQSQWGESTIQRADQDAQTISPDQVHRERNWPTFPLNHNA